MVRLRTGSRSRLTARIVGRGNVSGIENARLGIGLAWAVRGTRRRRRVARRRLEARRVVVHPGLVVASVVAATDSEVVPVEVGVAVEVQRPSARALHELGSTFGARALCRLRLRTRLRVRAIRVRLRGGALRLRVRRRRMGRRHQRGHAGLLLARRRLIRVLSLHRLARFAWWTTALVAGLVRLLAAWLHRG